jgi:AraC family transcriptional regulator of adaptative response / DNA-3-methyladenine glycosylase II
MKLVTLLVDNLGEDIDLGDKGTKKLFPLPAAIADHRLDFLAMPQARKDTLRYLARHFLDAENPDEIDHWINIKGIGPWTVNYAKIRAAKNPDIWLAGDAGVNNALGRLNHVIDVEACRPWRSYLTFQVWHQLVLNGNPNNQ